jgi:DNA-binding transcriptional MocR family regulator
MKKQAALVVSRRWKFGKVPTEVLASEMSIQGKMAFAVLDWHGDAAFPSHGRMARMMGCSVSSVRRGLDELVRAGWLSRQHRAGRTPVYQLGLPCSQGTGSLLTENRPPRRPCSGRADTNDTSENRDRGNKAATRGIKKKAIPAWARDFAKAGGQLTQGD